MEQDPREDVYRVVTLLWDLDRALHPFPIPGEEEGPFGVEPNVPPPLPEVEPEAGGGRSLLGTIAPASPIGATARVAAVPAIRRAPLAGEATAGLRATRVVDRSAIGGASEAKVRSRGAASEDLARRSSAREAPTRSEGAPGLASVRAPEPPEPAGARDATPRTPGAPAQPQRSARAVRAPASDESDARPRAIAPPARADRPAPAAVRTSASVRPAGALAPASGREEPAGRRDEGAARESARVGAATASLATAGEAGERRTTRARHAAGAPERGPASVPARGSPSAPAAPRPALRSAAPPGEAPPGERAPSAIPRPAPSLGAARRRPERRTGAGRTRGATVTSGPVVTAPRARTAAPSGATFESPPARTLNVFNSPPPLPRPQRAPAPGARPPALRAEEPGAQGDDVELDLDPQLPSESARSPRMRARAGLRFVSFDAEDLGRAERKLTRGLADRSRWRIR